MNETEQLKQRITELENQVHQLISVDRYRLMKDVELSAAHGTRIGTSASQKLAFFGADPVTRPTDGAGRSDITLDAGGTAHVGTTYTGNTGTTDYSVGDIVYVLKAYGLLT